jgi:hypothetical protein
MKAVEVKEEQTEVEQLKARIATLELQNAELAALVNSCKNEMNLALEHIVLRIKNYNRGVTK